MAIVYKYNAGDVVKFKDKFHPSASCGLAEKAGIAVKIAGQALAYNNKPHYYIEGEESVFAETCFQGRA